MDGARFGVVEDAEAEHERQGRSVPELEKRPGDRHPEQDLADCPARMPAARISLRDQLFELLEIDVGRLFLRFAHDALPCWMLPAESPRTRRPPSDREAYFSQPFSL